MISGKQNITLLIFFTLFLLLPILDNVFNFSPIENLFENRNLKTAPEFPSNIKNIPDYFKNFEAFFNDNYGLRKSFIVANNDVMDKIFNESPSSRALIGKDGWLYFDNQNSILDAQGLIAVDENKINLMARSLIKNWHELRAKNITYALIIAADKSSIYPEFLPDFIKISSGKRRADVLIAALKKIDPDFPVIDLRQKLLQGKINEQIYHKTDTHWNSRGAYIGYAQIMKMLKIKYHSRHDFIDAQEDMKNGDIANIMGIFMSETNYNLKENFVTNFQSYDPSDLEKKEFHKPIFYKNDNKTLPILFVYKDSFFDNMLVFFANHFSNAMFINEFPCNLEHKIIDKYQPNVVLQEFWEGRIEEVMNKCKE